LRLENEIKNLEILISSSPHLSISPFPLPTEAHLSANPNHHSAGPAHQSSSLSLSIASRDPLDKSSSPIRRCPSTPHVVPLPLPIVRITTSHAPTGFLKHVPRPVFLGCRPRVAPAHWPRRLACRIPRTISLPRNGTDLLSPHLSHQPRPPQLFSPLLSLLLAEPIGSALMVPARAQRFEP
jgi:hypothetical protein